MLNVDPSKPIWLDTQQQPSAAKHDIRIMVATPVHSEVSIHYTQSLLKFQIDCYNKNIHVAFTLLKSSLVTQGRNMCVASFLNAPDNYTHLLFIDSDIAFKSESIFKMLHLDKEVCAIPYPLKDLNWQKIYERFKEGKIGDHHILSRSGYQFPVKADKKESLKIEKGLLEVSHAPTGCMLIKREAINKMIQGYSDLKIKQPTVVNGVAQDQDNMWNFFDTWYDQENHKYYGEDFAFCQKWRNIGGKCYVLVTEELAHMGEFPYTASFLDEIMHLKKLTVEEK
jgi:hypothetical protein